MATIDLAAQASRCLTSWSSGDFETTRSLLSEDVASEGPLGKTSGADAYISGAAQMAGSVSGVAVKRSLVEGDDVCLFYDLLLASAGSLPTVGWYHFSDDKIDEVRAYFDPEPLTRQTRLTPKQSPGEPLPSFMPLFAAGLQVCLPE
jgi:hypothetical protein